jgi:hypothetical protein
MHNDDEEQMPDLIPCLPFGTLRLPIALVSDSELVRKGQVIKKYFPQFSENHDQDWKIPEVEAFVWEFAAFVAGGWCLQPNKAEATSPRFRFLALEDRLRHLQLKKCFPMIILQNNSMLVWPTCSGS